MKYILITLTLLILASCSTNSDKIEKSNLCFKELFTEDEFSELENWLNKFELFLKNKISKQTTVDNYDGYFNFVQQNGTYDIDSNYVKECIGIISDPLRNKIWFISEGLMKVPGEYRKTKKKTYYNIREKFKSNLILCSCAEEKEMLRLFDAVTFHRLFEFYKIHKKDIHNNYSLRLFIALELFTRMKNSY